MLNERAARFGGDGGVNPVEPARVADRRAQVRHPVALTATVGSDHEPPVGCRTVNVSLGGACVETPTLLGDHVVMVLQLDGGEARRLIPIAADVVDQTVDATAGVVIARVAFRRMTRGGRARLAERLTAAAV